MSRRWQINILLVVVITLLAGIALLRPGKEKPVAHEPISNLATDHVRQIQIEATRAPVIVLARRDNDTWLMQQPQPGRTNPFMVSALLRVLQARSRQQIPTDATTSLSHYGLANPRARLRLDDTIISFGDTNPVNNLQYVLLDGRIHMIDGTYFAAVTRPHTDFLSKQLLEPGRKPVRLELPGLILSLSRGSWHAKPVSEQLNADRLKQMVDDWRHAQALLVKTYEHRPVQEWLRIRFEASQEGGKEKTIRIGIVSRHPELVLYRPDEELQYHFPETIGNRLLGIHRG